MVCCTEAFRVYEHGDYSRVMQPLCDISRQNANMFYGDIMQVWLKQIFELFRKLKLKPKEDGGVPSASWLSKTMGKEMKEGQGSVNDDWKALNKMVETYQRASDKAIEKYKKFISEWPNKKITGDNQQMLTACDTFLGELITEVKAEVKVGDKSKVAIEDSEQKRKAEVQKEGKSMKKKKLKQTKEEQEAEKEKQIAENKALIAEKAAEQVQRDKAQKAKYYKNMENADLHARNNLRVVSKNEAELTMLAFGVNTKEVQEGGRLYNAETEVAAFSDKEWDKVFDMKGGLESTSSIPVVWLGDKYFFGVMLKSENLTEHYYKRMFEEETREEEKAQKCRLMRETLDFDLTNEDVRMALTVGGKLLVTAHEDEDETGYNTGEGVKNETGYDTGSRTGDGLTALVKEGKLNRMKAVVLDGSCLPLNDEEELKTFFKQIWSCIENDGGTVLVYMPVIAEGAILYCII